MFRDALSKDASQSNDGVGSFLTSTMPSVTAAVTVSLSAASTSSIASACHLSRCVVKPPASLMRSYSFREISRLMLVYCSLSTFLSRYAGVSAAATSDWMDALVDRTRSSFVCFGEVGLELGGYVSAKSCESSALTSVQPSDSEVDRQSCPIRRRDEYERCSTIVELSHRDV